MRCRTGLCVRDKEGKLYKKQRNDWPCTHTGSRLHRMCLEEHPRGPCHQWALEEATGWPKDKNERQIFHFLHV